MHHDCEDAVVLVAGSLLPVVRIEVVVNDNDVGDAGCELHDDRVVEYLVRKIQTKLDGHERWMGAGVLAPVDHVAFDRADGIAIPISGL